MKLSEHIALVRSCTNKDNRMGFRTGKEFHDLVAHLVEARELSGEAELIEKCVLYYAELVEKLKPFKPMTYDELEFANEHKLNIAERRMQYRRERV